MRYFWSEETKGFYLDVVHGDKMPADVVEVNENDYRKKLQNPRLVMPPGADREPPVRQQLIELDKKIPRALEDTWAVLEVDLKKLPLAVREAFSKKLMLRARVKSEASGS